MIVHLVMMKMSYFLNLRIWRYYGIFTKIREHDGRVLRPFSTPVGLGLSNEEEIQALMEGFGHDYSTAQIQHRILKIYV